MLSSPDWKVIPGKFPILLVAPHNCPHLRDGRLKPRDVDTGLLCGALAREFGMWSIITTTLQPDPNWYPDSPFRHAIKLLLQNESISCVLDIHGRKSSYPHLLEFTPNTIFANKFMTLLDGGYHRPLQSSTQYSITRDLGDMDIPCLQVEIRRDGRTPGTPSYNQIYTTLSRLLCQLLETVKPFQVPV